MNSLHPEVLPLRRASREMVRELGLLESSSADTGMGHSHWHALVEIEQGRFTQVELASRLRLDKSTTSRIVKRLVADGWVRVARDAEDKRRGRLTLTARGRAKAEQGHGHANARVQEALALLAPEERATVLRGMELYARALGRTRRRAGYRIRPVRKADNRAVAEIIRTVMPEFGAGGPGFAIHDPEVDDMFGAYGDARTAYFVLEDPRGRAVGGGGIAPLAGASEDTCELRKMYFLPEARGLGFGQTMLDRCLEAARDRGFRRCYLETLQHMRQARALYEKNGFDPLPCAEGATGHFGCDAWYARALAASGPLAP